MLTRTLLLPIAALLLAGCSGSTLSLIKRTPPDECMHQAAALKNLKTGEQNELELWVADTAPKYRDLKKDHECLKNWANESEDDDD